MTKKLNYSTILQGFLYVDMPKSQYFFPDFKNLPNGKPNICVIVGIFFYKNMLLAVYNIAI